MNILMRHSIRDAALAAIVSVSFAIFTQGTARADDLLVEDETITEDLGPGDDTRDVIAPLEALADATTVQPDLDLGQIQPGETAEAARSRATALTLFGNDGADAINNLDLISAVASAWTLAGQLSVSLVSNLTIDSVWNGGSFADANATAVDGGLGDNTVLNQLNIDASSDATSGAGSIALAGAGFAVTVLTTESNATSVGIASGDGIDTVTNSGAINSTATSTANTRNVNISGAGASASLDTIWDGGTSANSNAFGIQTGGGGDTINTQNSIRAESTASTNAEVIAATIVGVAVAEAASTADANATGIDGGDGDDTITVGGLLESVATANASGSQTAISGQGMVMSTNSRWNTGTTGDALAVGVAGGAGADTITNAGTIDADANANVRADAITVVASSDNGALDPSKLTSNAKTDVGANGIAAVRGIDGGDGDDTITNDSIINANAQSIVAVSETQLTFEGASSGTLDKAIGYLVGKGATTSTSLAEGVVGGAGADTITQTTGEINATAVSRLPALGVSLSATNTPSVNLGSKVTAEAIGINSGADNDIVTTAGSILADATSSATAVGFGLSTNGMEGGVSTDLALSSTSTGIQTGGGADTVTNNAAITSNARSPGQTATLVVALSESTEAAGKLERKKASATSKVTAEAIANGIVTDGAEDTQTVELGFADGDDSGGINVERITLSDIDGGQDAVTNSGAIVLDAFARTASSSASLNLVRTAASASSANATSNIVGIRTGIDNDTINNNAGGSISGTSEAFALAINGSISAGKGKAKATNKGTDATATAIGIDADGTLSESQVFRIEANETDSSITIGKTVTAASGDDTISNVDTIDMLARSTAVGVGLAFSAQGSSSTHSNSSAESLTTTIQGGGGADDITNSGQLNSRAVATSVAVAATISADAGLATATSGSNSADSTAVGIDGDGSFSLQEQLLTVTTSAVTEDDGGVDIDILNSSSSIELINRVTRSGGDDTIVNGVVDEDDDTIVYGGIDVSSVATNVTVEVAGVITKGVGAVVAESDADAEAVGIRGGDGDDDITNLVLIDSDATATAAAVGIAVTATGGSIATNKLMEGGTTATATSAGIQGDGNLIEETIIGISGSIDGTIGSISSTVSLEKNTTAASGVDIIRNSGEINSNAVATAPQVSVGIIVVQGVAGAVSTSTAIAESSGIQAGANDDSVTNSGTVSAGSVATAVAVNLTVDSVGVGISANSIADGGVIASATTVGIDTDGGAGLSTRTENLTLSSDGVVIVREKTYTSDDGADYLENSGNVTANATSVSPAVTGSIVGTGGVAIGVSTAEANASATALDSGGGDDTIINSGNLDAVATGNADAVNISYTNVGVAVASDAVWDGGATSNATAHGINSDGSYASFRETRTYSVGPGGATISHEIDEVFASGNDNVTNTGLINATSTAISPSIGVAIVPAGGAFAITAATSNSDAAAIVTGSGNDTISNTQTLGVISTSNADAVSVTFVVTGGVAASGNAVWDGGVTANATGSGIRATGNASRNQLTEIDILTGDNFVSTTDVATSGSGDNTVTNSGAIDVNSTAVSASLSGGISVAGLGVALSTSTANSLATGIETGDGTDTVTNSNLINLQSTAVAATLNISGVGGGVALSGDAFWDGGTSAVAEAAAIRTGAGNDNVTNNGTLDTDTDAVGVSAAVTVALYGVAASISTVEAEARSFGIETGAGVDTIINNGLIDTDALANANGADVTVNIFGVAASSTDVWDGGVTSRAFATGIDAGDGGDTITNNFTVDTQGRATSVDVSVPFTVGGVAGALSQSTVTSDVDGIDGGQGADFIYNHGDLITDARATAVAVTGSIGVFGVALAADAVWDGGTSSDAKADSIAGGDGNDEITNSNSVTTTTRSRANSNQIAVSVIGVAGSTSTSTATTEASSISGDGGDDTITNERTGSLLTNAFAHSTSVGVAVTGIGVAGSVDSVWEGGTGSDAKAYGIAGDADNDNLTNLGRVEAIANAEADSVQVAATGGLISVAAASSTATSLAVALDGGTGNDEITNYGALVVNSGADAQATAVAVTLAVGGAGASPFMDNQTNSNATAVGIDGGAQNDTITTVVDEAAMLASSIDVTATARTRDNDVAITGLYGFNDANANAKATATATGVAGGEGSGVDIINLEGTINVDSTSNALARSVTYQAIGLGSVSAATEAVSNAFGVDGGDGHDSITNAATIDVASNATTDGRATGLTAAGASRGGVDSSSATANATGITLGDGGNEAIDPANPELFSILDNSGNVTVTATSDATATSFGLALLGYSATNASSTATSNSFGLSGGNGADRITNDGLVTSTGDATVSASDVSFSIAGVAVGDSVMTTTSTSVGVSTLGGDDSLVNSGTVSAISVATGVVDGGNSIAIFGGGIDSGFATIDSISTGVATGDGADIVTNTVGATISANATADAQSSGNFTLNIAGVAANDLTMNPDASSTGVSTGQGVDNIRNDGLIDVQSVSTSTANGSSVSIAGVGSAVIGSTATASATGISSGADDDQISNNGTIEVGITDAENAAGTWTAHLNIDASSFAGAGASRSSSRADSVTSSTGITAGSGNDSITNNGTLSVYANALNDSTGSSVNIFGSADSTDNAGAITNATGISGDDGDDTVRNFGAALVSARTRLELDGSSYTLGGVGEASGSLTATTTIRGISGGAGNDTIENFGSLVVSGRSETESTGNSNTTFGGASTDAEFGATTTATGIAGGDDSDTIRNNGVGADVNVDASVDIDASSASYTFAGNPDTNAVLTGTAIATGISGDGGSDLLESDGNVTVNALVNLLATGGATATFGGGPESVGSATTNARATGFSGGLDDDAISSSGNLSVISQSNAASQNTSNSGVSIISNSRAEAASTGTSAATGFDGGSGSNSITNSGDAFVSATSTSNAVAYANGAAVSITGAARAVATSNALATAKGIVAQDGNNAVINDGALTVVADAGTSAPIVSTQEVLSIEANADPDTVEPTEAPDFEGDQLPPAGGGTQYDEGTVVFWNGTQDGLGNGPVDDPLISAPGSYYQVVRVETPDPAGGPGVIVSWEWELREVFAYEQTHSSDGHPTEASGRGHGANGNGVGTATGTTNAVAVGVELGDGNNHVQNDGSISVTADANSEVIAGAAGSTTGNATANATGVATARATGVTLGNGNNTFINSGDLSVTAIADTSATVSVSPGSGVCFTILFWEFCIAPGSTTATTTNDRYAYATGVVTGDGSNTIINDGNIIVTARANTPVATSVAGIVTGAGDDTVINNGTISATIQNLAGTDIGTGIGIDTGDGNDTVQLGDGSLVVGSIVLGSGDDSLILEGTPLTMNHLGVATGVDAGDGIDALILSGEGAYLNNLLSFEAASKLGDGDYFLSQLTTVEALTIDGGSLSLGSNYLFSPTGLFTTFINSDNDGTYGGLLTNGMATLDGAINVERRGEDFIAGGTRYSVIETSAGVLNAFADITLPEALPLLSFDLEVTSDTVDVVARASAFTTMASNALDSEVARGLDTIALDSSGEMRRQIGRIQALQSGFDEAYGSLSPDAHLASIGNTTAISQETVQLVMRHMSAARNVTRGRQIMAAAYEPVTLAFNGVALLASNQQSGLGAGGIPGSTMASPGNRTWLMAYKGDGTVDYSDGYTNVDHSLGGFVAGADFGASDSVIAGFSLGYSEVGMDLDHVASTSNVESLNGALYITAFDERRYIEGGVYFGRQDFDNTRPVTIGNEAYTADSNHDGDNLMVFIGGGLNYQLERWNVEPFANLFYLDVHEDAFAESGAGVLNQVIEARSAKVLLGELGAALSLLQPTDRGYLNWNLIASYNYDFDIDGTDIIYSYDGAPSTLFNIDDRVMTSGSVVLGAGLAYTRGHSIISVDYRGQGNKDYRMHILGLRLSHEFN